LSYDLESTLVCLTGQEVRNLHVSKGGCDCSLNLVSLSSLRAAMELSSFQRIKQMKAILIQRLHSFFPDKQRKSSTTVILDPSASRHVYQRFLGRSVSNHLINMLFEKRSEWIEQFEFPVFIEVAGDVLTTIN